VLEKHIDLQATARIRFPLRALGFPIAASCAHVLHIRHYKLCECDAVLGQILLREFPIFPITDDVNFVTRLDESLAELRKHTRASSDRAVDVECNPHPVLLPAVINRNPNTPSALCTSDIEKHTRTDFLPGGCSSAEQAFPHPSDRRLQTSTAP